ncbi:class I adenylate-forming enzyme family protein [Gordonibacter sp.]|uniref:class I adenylate-forming enzyme family protein n=1 Tax=Gordonibacter sp. TaxID=1968902 RepID=UPI002FC76481
MVVSWLVVRSPCMMRCYWRDPGKTAEMIQGGWLHTGDMASIDGQGYVRILGRIDGMIIRGGFNVYAAELEHLYSAHPSVLEVAAFPLPHPELGQQIAVALVCKRSTAMDGALFRNWAQGHLAKFKLPDRIVFFHELPKLPTGKVDIQAIKASIEP